MEFWGGLAFTYLPLKRFYKYILKRLIGSFLRHDIDLEQLDVQLYRGIVQLKALELDVAQLNLAALGTGFLLHFISGFIGTIKMDIPWRHLLGEHCKIYVDGLHLVLAKGSQPDSEVTTPSAADMNLNGLDTSPGDAQASPSNQHDNRPGRHRYSNEGIETLSRLVKHVISRMEVCFHDTGVSLLPPGTESQLKVRVASVVVFSEQPSNGAEARTVRVLGISLSLLQPCAAPGAPEDAEAEQDNLPSLPAGLGQEELVLMSTDSPHGSTLPGVLHIRQRTLDASSSELGASGVHLDIEFSLDSLRVALAPIVWPVLSSCPALFERPPLEAELPSGFAERGPVAEAPAASLQQSTSHRAPSMVQSLMESSLPGSPGNAGFWSELYNLFEGDSMLEDVAGRGGDMTDESWEEGADGADAEEVRALNASVLGSHAADADGSSDSGPAPVVGCIFQFKVRQIGVLLVLSDDSTVLPRPSDVQLTPGPAHSIRNDQLQLCVARWEATVLRPVADAADVGTGTGPTSSGGMEPKALVLIKTVCVHLHKHSASSEMQGASSQRSPTSGAADRDNAAAAAEEPTDSTAAVWAAPRSAISAALDEELTDPSMFCSAISTAMTAPQTHLAASAASAGRVVVESPRSSAESCRCSTEESFGEGSDDESFLHSAASSLHSFDSSVPPAPGIAAASSTSVTAAPDPLLDATHEDEAESQRLDVESESLFASVYTVGVDRREIASADSFHGLIPATEVNLEMLFFDRSQPIRDILFAAQGTEEERDGGDDSAGVDESGFDAGVTMSPCGWQQTAAEFQSKRILYFLSPVGPHTSSGSAEDPTSAIPNWTLPPAAHPLWASLRLGSAASGSTTASAGGHQVRVDWSGPSGRELTASMPATRVECQPIILSLCAESIQMLTNGVALLRSPTSTPQPTATPGGVLPLAPLVASSAHSSEPRPDQVFTLVSVTPLIRLELVLSTTPQTQCSIVGDIVAPRLCTLPGCNATADARTGPSPPASNTCYEERLHVELYDFGGYLINLAGSGDSDEQAGCNNSNTGLAGSRFGVGATSATVEVDEVPSSSFCMRILSLEETFNADSAAGSLSLFQRCAGTERRLTEPASREQDEVQSSFPAPESMQSPLSEWTKISLPQPDVESRSSVMLQDLRCASQRLLSGRSDARPSSASGPVPLQPRGKTEFDHAAPNEHERSGRASTGDRASASRLRQGPRSFSVDSARNAEGADASVGIASCEGELELEFKVTRNIRLSIDSKGLHLLQESFCAFTAHYAALALNDLTGRQTPMASSANSFCGSALTAPGLPVSGDMARPGAMLIPLGLTVMLECVQFQLLEGDATEAEQLQFRLSPLQCRFVQISRSSFKLCTLGQDLRLEGIRPLQANPDQLVRPWFRPILYTPADGCSPAARGTQTPAVSSSSYPWNVQLAQSRTSMVLPAFSAVEHGQWRDTHSLLLQVVQQRLGASDHTTVSLKVNRIAFHVHPHMQEICLRLLLFFRPVESNAANQPLQPYTPPNNFTDYELSTLDCLVDMPSEAYAQAWPITSPFGLNVPMRQPTTRGPDGDKWRAVMHIDGLDVSCGVLQGVKVHTGECNVFLVDHPSNLSQLDLISSSPQPVAFLSNLGFAHILEVTGAKARWRTQCSPAGGEADRTRADVQSGQGGRSLEVGIDSIAGHVCADTVKCLLCVGMELAESLASWHDSFSDKLSPSVPPVRPLGSAQLPPSRKLPEEEPSRARNDSAHSPSGVNILHNIDMFAFEKPEEVPSAGSGKSLPSVEIGTTLSAAAADALESCLIEDYIRTQEQQQAARSPVQASALALSGVASPSHPEAVSVMAEASCPAEAAAAASAMQSSSVAVCLLDPEAYPAERLRELCLQDRIARMEIEQMYAEESVIRDSEPIASTAPMSSAGAAESRKILHQDGSATLWLIDPTEVQVVQDHFTSQSQAGTAERRGLQPPTRSPPLELMVSGRCGVMRLSLYGGTDFGNDTQVKAQAAEASDAPLAGRLSHRKRTTHLTFELQESLVKLMSFSAVGEGMLRASSYSHSDIFRRRCVICAKEFGIIDHVQGSVFSHLVSYFEDDRRRPRQSQVDMFYLRMDEVTSPPPVVTQLGPQSSNAVDTRDSSPLEYCVDLQVLPLRLTLDQDVADFLLDFVQLCTLPTYVEEEPQADVAEVSLAGVVDNDAAGDEDSLADADLSRAIDEAVSATAASVSYASSPTGRHRSQRASTATGKALQENGMRFKQFSVSALLVSVDYRAKRLDVGALRRGELWELVNILPLLEGLEVAFRSVTVSGVVGLNQVLAHLVNAWSTDLNRTQILRSLTGVTPIRSFANIGSGFADMVLEPLKQYRAGKDSHQVSSALLRGLVSFLKHVTVESMDLTERILVGTQSALEYVNSCLREPADGQVAGVAGAGQVVIRRELLEGSDGSLAALSQHWTPVERGATDFLQPGSAAEGLQQACTNLSRGMRHAGQAVVGRPLLELQRGASREKVLKSIVSGIPVCVLRPAIEATAAATTALRGVRNSVDPVRRREVVKKYKEPE